MDAWKKRYEQRREALGYVPETLCELCGNACGGCRWSRKGEQLPVEGWEAVRRDVIMRGPWGKRVEESYIVLDCPEFEPEVHWWLYIINWDKELARWMAGLLEEERYGEKG